LDHVYFGYAVCLDVVFIIEGREWEQTLHKGFVRVEQ
jgi:hypothetical protein